MPVECIKEIRTELDTSRLSNTNHFHHTQTFGQSCTTTRIGEGKGVAERERRWRGEGIDIEVGRSTIPGVTTAAHVLDWYAEHPIRPYMAGKRSSIYPSSQTVAPQPPR